MNTQPLWLKFLVVFGYSGITAILPLLTTWLSGNPAYLVLIPILQGLWQTVEKYLTSTGYLGGTENGRAVNVWH